MTLEQVVPVVLACAAGLVLGLVYFGGLWLTIRQMPRSRHPVALFLASLILRSVIAVTGFFLIMGNHWERAIACLVGFMLVRLILTSHLRPDRMVPPVASDLTHESGRQTEKDSIT